jgi:signal transduction histidine kinase/DNA-binding response OmpR family regulator
MRRLTLRARLALLVLVGVVPFLAFNLGSSYLNYRHERIEADHRMLDNARGIALAVEGELRSRVAILEVLALSSALARNDMTAFRAEADAARALQESGSHILLLREDGQQLLNTALPPDALLPLRPGLDNLQRVFAGNRPSVSDIYEGQVLHRPIVAIEVPVRRSVGGVRVALSLTPMLDAFDGIIRRQVADQNLLVVIIDRTGRRIARFPADERLAGPMQPPEFMRVWRPGLEGTTQIVLPDGDHRILGFSPVPEFGWTVVVGISAVQLTAPAWHAAMITSVVGLGLLLVGGALAQLISRSVIGPLSKLARLASATERGDILTPIGTGLRETDEVAAILLSDVREHVAAMATQARDAHALKQSNKALTDEIAMREGAQAALRSAKAVADEASQAKSRFLTSITHELRTPLHGILGYAELLGLEGGLNPTQSSRVAAMIAAGEHLLGMINAVLDVSQIEAGRLELNPVEIELADLAAACLAIVRPKAEAKGLGLMMTVTTPGRVSADVTRLRQVLINLLGNAIKFTPSGKVDLCLMRTATGNGVRLEVVDTGPGIWARHRDKLFLAFERLNAHAAEGVEGTGLGLALTAQLVRAMDGRIGYTDNPGGGSIFWVELPAILDAPAAPNVAVAANRDTLPGVRLLVVDDDALNREIASRFLTLGGHDVVCLDNGFDAVEAAKTEDFDAILMDVRMPGMNGLEATRLIRMLPGPRGAVPVIALTAQAFAEQIEICRAAGMNAHVSKPFSQETLLATVAEMVPPRAAVAPVALPPNAINCADPEHPVFERATFEEAIGFLTPAEAADYLRTLIARGEALARDLRARELRSGADALADAAHKVAGAASMLGFLSLADIGRRFEFAADSDAPELAALADPLAAAVATAIAIMQQKLSEMAFPAMN